MNARSSAERGGWDERDRSRGDTSGPPGWKGPAEVTLQVRVEVMRQQYLAGTLLVDEQAVAQRILQRVLAY